MKNIYAVLLISMVGINGFGQQNNDKQLSNAEQFSAKSGTLIQKVFLHHCNCSIAFAYRMKCCVNDETKRGCKDKHADPC